LTSTDHDPATEATSPPGPAARAVGLVKTYGSGEAVVHALDGVDVEFERGRFTAVMGPSGSGKSTLMHCMAGLDTPTSGRTFVGDLEIGKLDDAGLTRLRRDRIGFVLARQRQRLRHRDRDLDWPPVYRRHHAGADAHRLLHDLDDLQDLEERLPLARARRWPARSPIPSTTPVIWAERPLRRNWQQPSCDRWS